VLLVFQVLLVLMVFQVLLVSMDPPVREDSRIGGLLA
jgi:hypothetical protein